MRLLYMRRLRTHTGDVRAWHHNSLSGHKIGYINERVFRYDANEYLADGSGAVAV